MPLPAPRTFQMRERRRHRRASLARLSTRRAGVVPTALPPPEIQVFAGFTGCRSPTKVEHEGDCLRRSEQGQGHGLKQGRLREGRIPVSVGQRPNFKAYPVPKTLQGAATSAAPPPASLSRISASPSNPSPAKKKLPPTTPAAGFLLLDSSRRLIWFNAEAVQILSYPETLANIKRPEVFVAGKIGLSLISRQPSGESPFVAEFRSGRRPYLCRAFLVDSHAKAPYQPSIALLLERRPSGLVPLSQVSQQFNLTRRERETLDHLLQGLSTKEIANQMNISPNTAKAFLRLIMVKMGVSSRSAVLAKMMRTKPA
jgi:DNA-binding CsgD family transcriptional regulator